MKRHCFFVFLTANEKNGLCAQTEHLINLNISSKLFPFASACCVVERLRTATAADQPLVNSRF